MDPGSAKACNGSLLRFHPCDDLPHVRVYLWAGFSHISVRTKFGVLPVWACSDSKSELNRSRMMGFTMGAARSSKGKSFLIVAMFRPPDYATGGVRATFGVLLAGLL